MLKTKLLSLISYHLERYGESQPRDIYKLIYQGVYGVGHLMSDKARDYLVEETGRIIVSDYMARPLLEPVSMDGSMVRVNLRPFTRLGHDLDRLFEVMVYSSRVKGDNTEFMELWNCYVSLVREGVIEMELDEVARIDSELAEKGIQAMHHTEEYREAYYPAYRVVLEKLFVEEFGDPGQA